MQNIQRFSRLAAAAAVSILTCAVATACAKKDQARNTNAAQNTASTAGVDTTQIAGQAGTTATPPTGGDSAGLQNNATPTSSLGGTVPPRTTTRRSNTARNSAVAGSAVARRSSRSSSSANVRVDENSSATMRSNREVGVTTRSGDSSSITATAAATDANWLAEPQIYNIVFLANRGDSALSARAICLNPNASVTASTPAAGASDAQVRSFAQQMVRDHAQLNQKAVQLAQSQNVAATRSDASDQVFSATQDAMNGSENGRDYINREVTAHQNLLNTLDTKLIPSARDTSLRRMLIDARAVVQSHLEQAQRLQSGQSSASASTSMSMNPQASASISAQPRPDTIRASATLTPSYQATTPSASTSITATAPAPSVTATTTTTTTTPTAMAPTATTTTSINATTPAPTATASVSTTNPCEATRPAAVAPSSTSPAVAPSTSSPSLNPSYTAPVKPDTIRVRSDSLRVRIDTGTTRQPAPAPAKP